MAALPPLRPARLTLDPNGIPRSDEYGDVYHSAAGGRAQARHVFLGGNDLPARWRDRPAFTILETGFGLGLNFLETWRELRADARGPERLHFLSVEKHPFAAHDLVAWHRRDPELAPLAAELAREWPPLIPGFHRLHLDDGRVALTLLFGEGEHMLGELEARADAIFLDGFEPAKNPDMWSPALCRELARLAAPGATCATWTVARPVRDALTAAGFRVEKRPGFAAKREMLAGAVEGASSTAMAGVPVRRAIVIGAGLAGATVAERLASRRWTVTVIERHDGPGREASGNPAGLLRPALNLADAANSRVSKAGLGYALRYLAALERERLPIAWRASGVLHLARDAAQAARMAHIVSTHGYPASFVRWVSAGEAADIARWPVRTGGWWFPAAAWAEAPTACDASFSRRPDAVTLVCGRRAQALEHTPDGWRVLDGAGAAIAAAPVVIVATAFEATAFPQLSALPLGYVRGQVTLLPADPARRLEVAVCGNGYVAPRAAGGHCVGATFQHDDRDLEPRVADHAENLAGLESMLPGFAAGVDPCAVSGRAALRATTPDRLPVFGAVDSAPGLYAATGLGARGLVWAPLGAELIASRLAGEPCPLERSLAAALAPGRFRRPTG